MIPVIPLPKLLNADGTEKRRLRPLLVRIQEKTVPLSTATIILKKDDVPNEREYIELFTINGSAGVYRVKAPAVQYGGSGVSVALEHSVCELGDYLVRNKEDEQQQKTLAAAVQHFFSYYNGGKWRLGSVSVSGNVIVQDSYQTVLTAINGAISQVDGARLAYDFTTTPWTLNIVGRETTVTAEGRLSRNVEDATISKNDTELCTRVWMDGLGNDGAIGYMDADTKSVYGIIEKYVATSGYTQAQAQTAAAAYLSAHKRPRYSVSLNAISLVAITGELFDQIRIGKLYRLAIPDDGVVIEENVVEISWPDVYGKPLSCTVVLSEPGYTAVSFFQQQAQQELDNYTSLYNGYTSGDNKLNNKLVKTEEDVDWVWRKTGIDSLGETETLMTRIQINAEGIQTEVSRANTAEGQLSSRITQAADAITAEVTRATTEEGTLSSRITQTATSISQEVTRATNAENSLSGRITTEADKISLVVESTSGGNVIKTASIIAGINDYADGGGSYIKISADAIDIDGVVNVTEARVMQSVSRWLTVETLHVQQNFLFGPDYGEARIGPIPISINGVAYTLMGVVS